MSNLSNCSDQELAQEADQGLRGQGAAVEMMQRLKGAIEKLERASSVQQERMLNLTLWITRLTWAMAVVGVIQLLASFISLWISLAK